MKATEWLRIYTDYLFVRLDLRSSDDRGLTTAEMAVLTVLLVGGAILVVGIIVAAAQNNANNIPDPQSP